ncbi:MAG: M20/M25/M40 family metallo-hydrolase [Myxococcota bacterium]
MSAVHETTHHHPGRFGVDDEALEQAVEHLVALVDRPSVSGEEGPAVDEAERIAAEDLDLPVRRMPVDEGRDNLLVGSGAPRVLLCTHLDTVPPFVPARREARTVLGRGAADAKGVAVAMLHALARLREAGEADDAAVLLVVGEETDHLGARAAAESDLRPEVIVLGEPCGMAPARAQKGILKLRLRARGCAGHSAYPEVGVSAIHDLLAALSAIRDTPLPADEALGPTTVNVGRLEGGVAANVIADEAEALVLVRCAAPVDAILSDVRERVDGVASVEEISRAEPIEFDAAGLEPGEAVPFNTDAHYLAPMGARLLLMGPGDMRCAHAEGEHLAVEDLRAGISLYADLVTRLT